jgi:hypothetical protein
MINKAGQVLRLSRVEEVRPRRAAAVNNSRSARLPLALALSLAQVASQVVLAAIREGYKGFGERIHLQRPGKALFRYFAREGAQLRTED